MKTLKALWKIFKYRPWLYMANVAISMVLNLIILLLGVVIKKIFDSFTNNTFSGTTGIILIILMFATYMGRVISFYSLSCTEITYRFSISGMLRHNLLKGILKKPGAKVLSKPLGDILNSFRDDAFQIEDYIYMIDEITGNFIFTLISLWILFRINYKITLLVFTPLIIIVAASKVASSKITKYRRASRGATSLVTANLGEVFSSIQAIQIANGQQDIVKNFENLNDKRQKYTLADNMFSQILNVIFISTMSIGTGLILLLGANEIKNGSLSVGDFTFFVFNLSIISYNIQFFGAVLAQFNQISVSLDRMVELIGTDSYDGMLNRAPLYLKGGLPKQESKYEEKRNVLEVLEVENLSFKYLNTNGGIENINFKIKRNSFTVITGRIGSGKTTLVRTLLGLLPKTQGEIIWNNEVVENPADFFTPPHCAYTPQVPHLFSETVKENILLGINEDKVNVEEAINSAIFDFDVAILENGLDTLIGPRGTKLSGGQQQRVAAARMFVRNSEILVFDDISSALDVETETSLWSKLFEKNNKTCIAVSNRRMALKKADNIIVLKDGKMEAQGSLEELLDNCEEMRLIWGDK